MASSSIPEFSAIHQNSSIIRDAVANSGDILKLADRLVEEEFIDADTEADIMENLTTSKRDKSRRFINAVETQVELDPGKFKVFLRILEEQGPLKSLAKKVGSDCENPPAGLRVTINRQVSINSSDSGSTFEEVAESAPEHQWCLLITALVELLDSSEKALRKMMVALEQLVLCKPAKISATPKKSKKLLKCFRIVESREYKEVKTVHELFKLLAPRWSYIEYSLLEFLLKASECEPAMERFREFLKRRKSEASSTFLPVYTNEYPQISSTFNGESPLNHGSIHAREVAELSSQESATFQVSVNDEPSGPPEPIPAGDTEIEMKLDKDEATVEEYDLSAGFLCGITAIPRYLLKYLGIRDGCISIRWSVQSQVLPYMHYTRITDEVLQDLADLRVMEVRIGTTFHLVVPTQHYWEGKREVEHGEIFVACASGNLQSVLQCLRLGVDVDTRDELRLHTFLLGTSKECRQEKEQTLLIVASRYGHVAIVQVLLERKAYIHAQDQNAWTAIARASCEGHIAVVGVLLIAGANPDSPNKAGVTPLMYASSRGHLHVVELLLRAHANPNLQTQNGSTALMSAADKGHSEIIVRLLAASAIADMQNREGATALMEASNRGYLGSVRELLDGKADVNKQDRNGETALAKASFFGYHAVVRKLLRAGAQPDLRSKEGRTPLMVAVKRLQDQKLQEELGITREGRYRTTAVLLEHRADPNITEPFLGWTALFFAAKDGDIDFVKLLLNCGADPKIKDKDKVRAVDVAKLQGHSEVCEELLKHFEPKERKTVGSREAVLRAVRWLRDQSNRVEGILRRKKMRRSQSSMDDAQGTEDITAVELETH